MVIRRPSFSFLESVAAFGGVVAATATLCDISLLRYLAQAGKAQNL